MVLEKKNRVKFETVGELRQLLSNLPDETTVHICGMESWFHAPADFSYVILDDNDLEIAYEEHSEEWYEKQLYEEYYRL